MSVGTSTTSLNHSLGGSGDLRPPGIAHVGSETNLKEKVRRARRHDFTSDRI